MKLTPPVLYARMIVYTTTLVNIACLIVIAWGMIGIDARLTLGVFNVSSRIGTCNVGLMSTSSILLLVVLQVSYFVVVLLSS